MTEYIYEHMQSGADHMGRPVEQPTLVQREEIVRCRDCEWYLQANSMTGWNDVCNLADINVQSNGFCAWGKRKEGGK